MSNEVMENEEKEKLLRLAEEKKYRQLKEALLEINEVDIASFMEELDSEKTVIVFRMLPKALATDVFAELPAESQSHSPSISSAAPHKISSAKPSAMIRAGGWVFKNFEIALRM